MDTGAFGSMFSRKNGPVIQIWCKSTSIPAVGLKPAILITLLITGFTPWDFDVVIVPPKATPKTISSAILPTYEVYFII